MTSVTVWLGQLADSAWFHARHVEQYADMACRCASLDGDADRLVYFRRHGSELELFDGDSIAVLAALLVMDILKMLPATEQQPPFTVGGLALSTMWSDVFKGLAT